VDKIDDDLTPSNPDDDGSTEHEYPVTVTTTVTDSDENTSTDSVEITVVVQNPCVNSAFVKILPPAFEDIHYDISTNPESYTHARFTIKTTPVSHLLCGNLVYEPRYNNLALTGNPPVTYATSTRKFTVESTDEDLENTVVPYSVIATLVNYPLASYSSAPKEEGGANVLYGNPCDSPVLFEASV
jgi:hypothetical protein